MFSQSVFLSLAYLSSHFTHAQESASRLPPDFQASQDSQLPTPEFTPGFPTGVADYTGDLITGLPLPCTAGCFAPIGVYYSCFLNTTLPFGGEANQEECNDFLCQQENYDQLFACLNCIVANGNERPYGYHTNPSLTAVATDDPFYPGFVPVGGYIGLEQANGWLANVTDRCQSLGSAIGEDVTTSITATPTTTGPYVTSWTSGQTLQFTTWTGLTEYSDQFFPTPTPVWGPSPTGTGGSSTTSSAQSDAAIASEAATSAPNIGSIQATTISSLWFLPVLGLFGLL